MTISKTIGKSPRLIPMLTAGVLLLGVTLQAWLREPSFVTTAVEPENRLSL